MKLNEIFKKLHKSSFKKKAVSLALAAAMLIPASSAFAFSDIDGHWAYPYISEATREGLLESLAGPSFYPDQMLTREECAGLIYSFIATYNYGPIVNPPDGISPFWDVADWSPLNTKLQSVRNIGFFSIMMSPSHFYEDENLLTFNQAGIIDGYPDGSFRPYDNVTRAEFAKMLMSTLDAGGYISLRIDPDLGDHMGHWGETYLAKMMTEGIMNGYWQEERYSEYHQAMMPYTVLLPDNNITRAEAVKMIMAARELPFVGMDSENGTRPEGYNPYPFLRYFDENRYF